jgi:hypothetical protein
MKKYLLILIAALFCFGDGLPTQPKAEARSVVVVRGGHHHHHHHYRHVHRVTYRRVYKAGYWGYRHGHRCWYPGRYIVVRL